MNPGPLVQWRELPMVRLVGGLLIGITLNWAVGPFPFPLWAVVALTLLSCCLLAIMGRRIPFQYRSYLGFGIFLWFILLGSYRAGSFYGLNQADHFSHQLESDSSLWLQASVQNVRTSSHSLRLTAEVQAASSDGENWRAVGGQILWYWPIDSAAAIYPGTEIMGQVTVAQISGAANPHAFDFSTYQARQNTFHQARGNGRVIGQHFHLRRIGEQWRENLMQVLREHLPAASNELAVGAALILGKRDELQEDLRNAYADTGAIHVLAVSGLHVGFIAFGLGWLLALGPLGKRSLRWLRLVLILLGIWTFALITGLSPSVLRAATMFSFIQLGMVLDRRASIYNTLAASAFLLLLINPFLLFDIGFQLSYLAVLGIVFFQPKIYRAWHPPNQVLDYCWKLTAVAIAAQLTTFPISLFYFHQFPVYFWLSGLVVVTAASIILGLGVLLFIVQAIPLISTLVGTLLYAVLWLTNAFIFAVQALPGGLLSGIWIGVSTLILLYIAIMSLGVWTHRYRAMPLLWCLGAILLAGVFYASTATRLSKDRSFTIYHLYKETLVDYFDGSTRFSLGSSSPDAIAVERAAKGHRDWHRSGLGSDLDFAQSGQEEQWFYENGLVGFYGHRMLIIDHSDKLKLLSDDLDLAVDVVLLRNSPRLSLQEAASRIQAQHWVFDGSNYPSFVERWLIECDSFGLNGHATSRQGAFISNIRE